MAEALKMMSEEELKAYILMERIFPPTQSAYLLREGHLTHVSICITLYLAIYHLCICIYLCIV